MKNVNDDKIYIVMSQTGTILSRILKRITGADYNHVSLGISKELDVMYSFGRKNPYYPFWGGFVEESKRFGTFKRFYKTEALVLELNVGNKKDDISKFILEFVNNNRTKFILKPWLDEVSLQADGYYNKVKDKIVAIPTLFVWKMMNLGEVDILGTDVNVGTALSFGTGVRMMLNGSWSYQYAVDVTSSADKNYRHQIPYTPRNSGSLSVSFLNKWVDVGYLMNGVGERYALPQNTESNRIAGYVEHSASLSRSFEVGRCRAALQLECQNFTDVQYEVIQYYPMPARSYRITVKVNF